MASTAVLAPDNNGKGKGKGKGNGMIYVFGGVREAAQGTVSSSLSTLYQIDTLNPAKPNVKLLSLPNPPTPLIDLTGVIDQEGKIYYFGGQDCNITDMRDSEFDGITILVYGGILEKVKFSRHSFFKMDKTTS
ncbi:hypothetical protein G9A89_021763 [Geosiphon pyriformis]|nr:hypothetical protein G9A89_021763 [Geosiphon pyriformis]